MCAVYIEIYALQCLRNGYDVIRYTMIIHPTLTPMHRHVDKAKNVLQHRIHPILFPVGCTDRLL